MKKMFLFFFLFLIGCSSVKKSILVTRTEMFMNTTITINVVGTDTQYLKKSLVDVMAYMKQLAAELNVYSSTNVMAKINNQASEQFISMTTSISQVIAKSLFFSKISDGYFDITMAPLGKAWDFRKKKVPSKETISKLLPYANYKNIVLSNGAIKFLSPHTKIDTGGIAKGYIIDKAYVFLAQRGIKSGLINAGGDIYAWGCKPDNHLWKIGIQDPRNSLKFVKTVEIKNEAIVTSGDYERFFIKNGKRYFHIINPKTGYSDSDIMSATIVTSNATMADGLSTTVLVMGVEKATNLLRKHFPKAKYLIIYKKEGIRKQISNLMFQKD